MGACELTVGGETWRIGATALGTATIDGEEVTRTQACIVAALALGAPGTVSTDQLIAAVWVDQLPRAARASLQNQITRLRRRFGTDVIETTARGYRLGRTTDVQVVDQLMSRELATPLAVGAGDASPEMLRQTQAYLVAALSLWSGTPFEALDDVPRAEAERARLTAMRSTATERLAGCCIALGDPHGAIAELSALVEEEPYREQLWVLLITALALDGRRAEAVLAHQRVTLRLGTDLGLEPCEELAELRAQLELDTVAAPFRTRPSGPSVPVIRYRCAHTPLRQRAQCST